MDAAWRAKRKAELQDLRFSNPVALVVHYRDVAGIDDEDPLPAGASYASIIQAILDHEATGRESTQPQPKAKKVNPSRPILTLNDPTITLIEHLRSAPARRVNREKSPTQADAPLAEEVFGPIDIYNDGIDWIAAARFASR